MTAIIDKKRFIELIKKTEDNKIFIFSNTPLKISGATKNKKGEWKTSKSISFQYDPEIFKEPERINDLIQSSCFGIIICDKKILSGKIKKYVKGKEE